MGRRDSNRYTIMRPLGRNPTKGYKKRGRQKKANRFERKETKRNQKLLRRKPEPTHVQLENTLRWRTFEVGEEIAKMPIVQESIPLPPGLKAVVANMLSGLSKDEVDCPISELKVEEGLPVHISLSADDCLFYGYEECQRCLIDNSPAVLNGGYIYTVQRNAIVRRNPWTNRTELFCDLGFLISHWYHRPSSLHVDPNGDYLYTVVPYLDSSFIVRVSTSTRIVEIVHRHRTKITAFAVGRFRLLLFATPQRLYCFQYDTQENTGKVIKWKFTTNLSSYKFDSISSIAQTLEGSIYIMVRRERRSRLFWLPCSWNTNCEPSWGLPRQFDSDVCGALLSDARDQILFPSLSSNTLNCPGLVGEVILNWEPYRKFIGMMKRIVGDCCGRHGFVIPTALLDVIFNFNFQLIRPEYNTVKWKKSSQIQQDLFDLTLSYIDFRTPRSYFDWSL